MAADRSDTAGLAAPGRFAACAPYSDAIREAVRRRFPRDFQYPAVWQAQLYQESLCDPDAISPVGAGGIAQFMPRTAQDMAIRLGFDFDRYNAAQAIDAGAYYQARRARTFRRRGRTPEQAHELGLACYNAGCGNILKAQRLCDNARLWSDISPCLSRVTGRHADETRTYVSRIRRWTNEAEDAQPWNVPAAWRLDVTLPRRTELAAMTDTRRWFTGRSWCTYFRVWGGWATAAHCHDEASFLVAKQPDFIEGLDALITPDLDAAFYGVTFPDVRPRDIDIGETIETVGFPAGSDQLTYRRGTAYLRRTGAGFIILLPAGPHSTVEREPVVGGQSGSPGVDADGHPVCIVTAQGSPTDLTGDGRPDHSFDCVPLSAAWEAFQ